MGSLRFQLFRFPIRIEPSYWLVALLLGWWIGGGSVVLGLLMAAVVFASILVHELGHAFAARSFGLKPQISLHMLGGTTAFAPTASLTRGRDIMISLSGPFAGFALGIFAWLLFTLYSPGAPPQGEAVAVSPFIQALQALVWVNLLWGAINLVPVVPFDGGRVLAAALGPQRRQLTATISLVAGLGLAVLFLQLKLVIWALLIGSSAVSSFFRIRQTAQAESQSGLPSDFEAGSSTRSGARPNVVVDESLAQALRAARQALNNQSFEQADTLARGVLGAAPAGPLRSRAAEIAIWATLGKGQTEEAHAIATQAADAGVDAYALGAAHEAGGALDDARRVLGRARAHGDSRVELTALLVKVMLAQSDFSSAATLTREIVDQITPDDVRRVATEASDGGAREEAARLSLDLARVEKNFRDAYEAVVGFAQAGAADGDLVEAFKLARSFDREGSQKLLDDERLGSARAVLDAV